MPGFIGIMNRTAIKISLMTLELFRKAIYLSFFTTESYFFLAGHVLAMEAFDSWLSIS